MSRKRNNRLPMVDVMVANGSATFAKTGTLVGAGSALGIADGQVGVMSADFHGTLGYGEFLTGGETTSDIRAVQVIQGTPASANTYLADPWEVGDKGYKNSGTLIKDQVISLTESLPHSGQYSATFVTDIVTPEDLTEYGAMLELKSRRLRKEFGANGVREVVNYLTPDYTTLGTVDPKDHMLQNMLSKLNTASNQFVDATGKQTGRKPFICLGVNIGGGSGQVIGTLAEGASFDVMTWNGNTVSLVANNAIITSLAQLVVDSTASGATAKLTATSTIEVMDAANAGAAADVDAFIVFGLEDPVQLGVDTETTKMVRVDTNLKHGFRVSGGFDQIDVAAIERRNSGKDWVIENRERAQRNIHNLYAGSDYASFNVLEGANYVTGVTPYASVVIDYYDFEETLTHKQDEPKQLVLLFEAGEPTATTVNTAVTALGSGPAIVFTYPEIAGSVQAGLLADYNAILKPWIASNDNVTVETF